MIDLLNSAQRDRDLKSDESAFQSYGQESDECVNKMDIEFLICNKRVMIVFSTPLTLTKQS